MAKTAQLPEDIPGPPAHPTHGYAGNYAYFMRDPIGQMVELQRRFGNVVGLAKPGRSMVFGFGPPFNRTILRDTSVFHSLGLTVHGPVGSAQRRLGVGLFTMNTHQNREHRGTLMPPLHKNALAQYQPTIVRVVDRLMQRWRGAECWDIRYEMKRLTLSSTGLTLFGMDLPDRFPQLEPMISYWFHMNSWASVRLSPQNSPTPAYQRMLGVAQRLEQIIIEIINTRRSELNGGASANSRTTHARKHAATAAAASESGPTRTGCPADFHPNAQGGPAAQSSAEFHTSERRNGGPTEGSEERDVLAILIRAHEAGTISYPELIGHTTTMFTAAFETTADSLTWTLFLLAQHPTVFADVLDELEAKLGGNPPTSDQVDDLPMLEHAIKESLRLLGPAVYNTRFNIQPAQLGDHELPRGSTVFFSHYLTHRWAELYPEPQRFKPERWQRISPGPYEYLPFGAGRRMCIGASYAMMSMKTTLAMLLQTYRFQVADRARIDRHVRISLASARGMPMHLHSQDRAFRASRVQGNIHEMIDLNRG